MSSLRLNTQFKGIEGCECHNVYYVVRNSRADQQSSLDSEHMPSQAVLLQA